MQNNSDYVVHINNWIEQVSEPLPGLGGYATCPFAKQAQRNQVSIEKISVADIIPPADLNFEIIIYVVEDTLDPQELYTHAQEFNSKYSELIFLADHPKDPVPTGVNTHSSNGQYNLLLCQPKDKLRKARESLTRTQYYSFWNPEYLKKIMGVDYVLLD